MVDAIVLAAQMMDAASIIACPPLFASVVTATVASATVVSREKSNGGKDVAAAHERRYTPMTDTHQSLFRTHFDSFSGGF